MLTVLFVVLACSPGPITSGADDTSEPRDSGSSGDDGGLVDDTGGDGGATGDGDPCIETMVPLSAATPPVTLDEVWPVVQKWSPSSIEWLRTNEITVEGETEAFAVNFAQTGEPSVVTRTGWEEGYETHPTACRPGPELRIPVTAVVTVADGQASATHIGYIDALAPEPTRVFFSGLEADPITLAGPWQEAAAAQLEAWGYSIEDATRIYAYMITSQSQDLWQPEWVVEVLGETPKGGGWGGVLWQGATDE